MSPEVDSDPRSKYFEQAWNGVPVRMALIALLLGLKPWKSGSIRKSAPPKRGREISNPNGVTCANENCVTRQESESTKRTFYFLNDPCVRFVCTYCDWEIRPSFYAYGQEKTYHPTEGFTGRSPSLSKYTFFQDEQSARAHGLKPLKKASEGAVRSAIHKNANVTSGGGARRV